MDPVRTCALCRKKATRQQGMLRFVRAPDGEICLDLKASLPSRGAWLCANRTCIKEGLKRKVLFRKLPTIQVNEEAMIDAIANRVCEQLKSSLGLMRKMGDLVLGRDAAVGLAQSGEAAAVLLASDLSLRSQKDMREALASHAATIDSMFSMDDFGRSLGCKRTGVVALKKGRITQEILRLCDMVKNLSDGRGPTPASLVNKDLALSGLRG